ncbi:Gfo/Idh/MocA family oxidoreductase [Rhizobium sp. S163]|uniref:Gfo/Idh/MocA family protein n=1 Tax=Rhizobium sp. S163 TaxID=3055039 RepID=UPI0025A933AD|nr:Gfo/Idh/MocA family oxidoreductase [Rhizobium sp. S163]MDM9645400.1 Gfo/Idh/MocA family oxidoreductase [Rhizobium sp. S163]
MSRKFRVGVIGAGIAARHLAGFAWNKELFDVVVLCSLDADRGKALCEEFAIPEYTQDAEAMICRADLDIIDICTPPSSHFDLCRKAIEAGKHVICEKPLFGSIAEVDEMAGIVAKANGPNLMPIFQYRYGSGLQKLKMLIDLGLAGEAFLTTIETHWWRGPDYYAVPWRGKWATELGGGLLGHAIHAHDMLNYIHGPCAELFCFGSTLVNPIEVEDTAALSLKMKNGSLASLSMTLGSREEISRLRFCFRNLVADSIVEPYTMGRDPWTFKAGNDEHQEKVDAALARFEVKEDGYTRQFELFYHALMRNEDPPVTLADARNSLELVTAAYQSQRTGLPTSLPILPDHTLYHSWLPEGAR